MPRFRLYVNPYVDLRYGEESFTFACTRSEAAAIYNLATRGFRTAGQAGSIELQIGVEFGFLDVATYNHRPALGGWNSAWDEVIPTPAWRDLIRQTREGTDWNDLGGDNEVHSATP